MRKIVNRFIEGTQHIYLCDDGTLWIRHRKDDTASPEECTAHGFGALADLKVDRTRWEQIDTCALNPQPEMFTKPTSVQDQIRSQVYLEMSKDAIRTALELKHPAVNIYDADILKQWNASFKLKCADLGVKL